MNYEALEKLVALKEKGILSEEEFQTEKKKLLNSTNEVSQNTTTQEETTSQIVEQNNYNANPILQEHKTKGSPEKTVLLVILIPIVIIGIMWFLDKKDSTPSYNYTPSSNYTSTTSPTTSTSSSNNSTTTTNTNTTNTSKYTSNSSIQNTSSTTSVNTNNKTSSITKNPEDLTNEEVAEILWGKEYTEFGKDIIGPTLFYFDKSLNPKEEWYKAMKKVHSDMTLNIDPKKLAHIYLFAYLIRWGEFTADTEFDAALFDNIARTAEAAAKSIEQKWWEDVWIFKLMEFGYYVSYYIDKWNDKETALKNSYKAVYGKTSLEEASKLYNEFVDSTEYLIQENIPTNAEYDGKK